MTEETDKLAPEWVTPESEKEQDSPNQFLVRGLDTLEALDLVGELTMVGDVMKLTGRGCRQAVKLGVTDAKGRHFPDGLTDEGLKACGAFTLSIVANKVLSKSQLSGEEAKN